MTLSTEKLRPSKELATTRKWSSPTEKNSQSRALRGQRDLSTPGSSTAPSVQEGGVVPCPRSGHLAPGQGPTRKLSPEPPPRLLASPPARGDLLEGDEALGGDVQLVDDRVEDVGVAAGLRVHRVAVAVGHGQEDPLLNAEDLPVGGSESLHGWHRMGP